MKPINLDLFDAKVEPSKSFAFSFAAFLGISTCRKSMSRQSRGLCLK